MKRRRAAAALLLLLLLFWTGCSAEKINRYVGDLGEKVIDASQKYMDQREAWKEAEEQEEVQEEQPEAVEPKPVQAGVEMTEEAVFLTLDVQGTAQIHSFLFREGKLATGSVYMDCATEAEAARAKIQLERANETEAVFENIRAEGCVLTAAYSAQGLARYQGCTLEQMRDLLAEEYNLSD